MASQFQTAGDRTRRWRRCRASWWSGTRPRTAFYLKMNTKKPPTDDLHIRRAIACAVDYNTVRTQIEPGARARRAAAVASLKLYHLASLKPAEQDLGCAKDELAKSKYASAGPVKLTLSFVGGLKFEEELGAADAVHAEPARLRRDARPGTVEPDHPDRDQDRDDAAALRSVLRGDVSLAGFDVLLAVRLARPRAPGRRWSGCRIPTSTS